MSIDKPKRKIELNFKEEVSKEKKNEVTRVHMDKNYKVKNALSFSTKNNKPKLT